uniref:Uncharacterized protein n=1 Tax=Arundo donax TaxID=35708 RepID=A0A0A9A4D8_ARUDO
MMGGVVASFNSANAGFTSCYGNAIMSELPSCKGRYDD